jgi:FixJ family two-component response regulator
MSHAAPLCIAVVDDDEGFARSLSRLLRAAGMHPVTYESAELFLADAEPPHFDCLVFDVHLGDMSGIELGRRLVAAGRFTSFICITCYDEPEARAEAAAAGCSAFFHKADSGAALLDAIRRTAG